MKRTTKVLAVAGAALAMSTTSCVKVQIADRSTALIVASIENTETRASGTSWDADDRIGISTVPGTKTVYSNVPYKWDGSKFNPESEAIYFQSAEDVTFNAYCPYNAAGGTVTATTDFNAQKNQPAIDFLYASGATAGMSSPAVQFTGDKAFRHRMSQISLTFVEGDDMEFTGKLDLYTLGGLVLKGEFNTGTGLAQAQTGETPADLPIALENVSVTNKKYSAAPLILFPQDVAGGKIAMKVQVDGVEFATELILPDADGDGVKDTALKPGYNYTFSIRVSKTAIVISTAEISPWDEVAGDAGEAVMI